jgi:coenzyme F420 hydrogenase subunit beta
MNVGTMAQALGLDEIVAAGLCIGCGLCRSMAGKDRVHMEMTSAGAEVPVARQLALRGSRD